MDRFKTKLEIIRFNLLKIVIFCPLLFVCAFQALAGTVLVISEDNVKHQETFLSLLKENVPLSKDHLIKNISLNDLSKQKVQSFNPSIIISLSNKISKEILSYQLNTPTIHALALLSNINKLTPCLPNCSKKLPQHHFLVLDQPPARQIKLIELIKPNSKELSILYTQKSALIAELYLRKKQSTAFKIHTYKTKPSSLGHQLNAISKKSDIILAIADTDIFNASTLPQILLTSYRYQTPVIGFSRGFVKAGALAAIVSDIPQLAKQLAELIRQCSAGHSNLSEKIIYPKYFNVISNRNVARSLFLVFPNDKKLTLLLQSNEALQ